MTFSTIPFAVLVGMTLLFAVALMVLLRDGRLRHIAGAAAAVVAGAGLLLCVGVVVLDQDAQSFPITYLLVLGISLCIGDALVTTAEAAWRRVTRKAQ